MTKDLDIVLASGSPRRRELLRGLGWNFRVLVPEIDETPREGESPEELCTRLAVTKALAGGDERSLVIAADTLVVVNGDALGKPTDEEDSLRMIRRLQGRDHEVLTGMGIRWKKGMSTALERTRVYFRPLDDEAVRAYVETKEGMDKAGAYAIQGRGSLLVSSIEGDYFNVVGLPLCRLGSMLEEMGLALPHQLQGASRDRRQEK
ncbi:MAG: Maf family protein [Synergistaceae bacterium]|jgi:septum formation protein|nr:Maf family protein [Synergistaceae bacterium]